MSSIQKRTKQIRDTVLKEWHERWWQFIICNVDKKWDWYWISCNKGITMKDILDNPDKPWNWEWISSNPNITMKDINNNPEKPWNWESISRNPSITIKDINDNHELPWNWLIEHSMLCQ